MVYAHVSDLHFRSSLPFLPSRCSCIAVFLSFLYSVQAPVPFILRCIHSCGSAFSTSSQITPAPVLFFFRGAFIPTLRSTSPDSQFRQCSSPFHVSSLNPPSKAAPLRYQDEYRAPRWGHEQMGIRYPASLYGRCYV